jgi:hypothetical protein
MADDAHKQRFQQHEDILHSLTAMLAAQHMMNEEQREMNREQWEMNHRLEGAIERLEEFNRQQVIINQRLNTLLTRMMCQEDNGRNA